ncbi:hypothetical protein BDV93DRAFT_570245 [Ceratobasidium sp. AG-I]|nr:hypothetical protein BDV93DRAFT_570245 [Ceratobasidium sp. AG-I]
MSSWSSTPTLNDSLTSALGSRDKQCINLQFPLELDWYKEQTCTTFRTLQHRKERAGFWHEYIMLQLQDGSFFRLERMGDPYARVEALSTHGTSARDIAQWFRLDEISEAHLESSDIVTEVTFPEPLDVIDALRVCRAIQEGERTCSYTLLSSNCYFFTLAIQACLTRLVTDWRIEDRSGAWIPGLKDATDALSDAFPLAHCHSIFLLRVYSTLLIPTWPFNNLASEMQKRLDASVLLPQVNQELEEELWFSRLSSRVNLVCENIVKGGVVHALEQDAKNRHTPDRKVGQGDTHNDSLLMVLGCKNVLAQLVLIASQRHGYQTHSGNFGRKEIFCRTSLAIEDSHMDFRPPAMLLPQPIDAVQVAGYSQSWVQQAASWIQSIPAAIMQPSAGASSFNPQTFIDESIHDQLDQLAGFRSSRQVYTILEESYVAYESDLNAEWREWPWTFIHNVMNAHLSEHTHIHEGVSLVVTVPGIMDGAKLPVSRFQDRIMDRIRLHARFVQSWTLGFEVDLSNELVEKLSRVWFLMRSDHSPVLKSINPTDQGGFPPAGNENPNISDITTSHDVEHESPTAELSVITHDTQPPAQSTNPMILGLDELNYDQINLLADAPIPIELAPTTYLRRVESVKVLFLQSGQTRQAILDIPLKVYDEGSRPIPDLQSLLGDPNRLCSITVRHGPLGQLGRPYQIFFQGLNPNERENSCVLSMTGGSPRYQWFGDIVVLKLDGRREERYIDASSNDIPGIAHFFAEQLIQGQPN